VKIIEAMKEIKRLNEKAADLRKKVATHCADLDFETPMYPDQKRQVDEWMQSHSDTVARILQLRVAIQATNLQSSVAIELAGKHVTKSIAEWVHRRRDLAKMEVDLWGVLGDRGLKEGTAQQTSGQALAVKIRRYYDPAQRDQKLALYREEPSIIDAQLEVTNAVTDVIGL
jgi:hypothetical protein